MAKELLNEAERYLLQNWSEARLLEESMEEVRTKYAALYERVVEAVVAAHPKLDAHRIAVTQFWGNGYIGFGCKSWPGGDSTWPTGFWISELRLEVLADDNSDSPYAYVEFSNKAKYDLDYDRARKIVNTAARKLLTADELEDTVESEAKGVLLWLPTPTKKEVIDALMGNNVDAFVKLFVARFDTMAKLIPALDQVFRECVIKD